MNLGDLSKLPVRSLNEVWYRAVQAEYFKSPLAFEHTSIFSSRFSHCSLDAPSYEILYFGENQHVALQEVRAIVKSPRSGFLHDGRFSWLIANTHISLNCVIDLTLPETQRTLSTTAQELTGDWVGYFERASYTSVSEPTGAAPTHRLGKALFESNCCEGFITISAASPTERCLVIFPEHLESTSEIAFENPITGERIQIPNLIS